LLCVVLSSWFCKFLLIYELTFGAVTALRSDVWHCDAEVYGAFFLAKLHWQFFQARTVQQPMLLDIREGIPFVLLLIYVAKAGFASQVHAFLTGWMEGLPTFRKLRLFDKLYECHLTLS
jgi:hypothetical protein